MSTQPMDDQPVDAAVAAVTSATEGVGLGSVKVVTLDDETFTLPEAALVQCLTLKNMKEGKARAAPVSVDFC